MLSSFGIVYHLKLLTQNHFLCLKIRLLDMILGFFVGGALIESNLDCVCPDALIIALIIIPFLIVLDVK